MSTSLPRRRIIISAAALLLAALTLVWTFVLNERQGELNERQGAQIDALYEALGDEQSNAEAQGLDPVAPAPDEIIDDPDVEATPPERPTDEQVLEAVEAYFAEHPVEDGEDASPAAIAAAVINYLTENPVKDGEPGPAPTAEQISTAVATYLAANPPAAGPPGADGQDGEDGADAEPLSSAEIQAEVDAYLDAHPIEMCDPGWTATVLTVLTVGAPTDITTCVRSEEN